ncbi:MAG TPA: tetratricopeptide repeat protein [Longimicrobium sp.]|nr:tetratricopeptide repeat protein [Longimicrobium sp.]
MSPRALRIDAALKALPDTADLAPLREALLGAARADDGLGWADAEAYATVETRLADPAGVEAMVPALAERARARVEEVMRHTLRALHAMQAGDEAEAARHLVAAGEAEERERRLDEAERCYARALELGRRPRDRRAEGLALRRLGRIARTRGDWKRAGRLYAQGHEVALAQRDTPGVVTACQGLGNVAVDQGRWAEARGWYRRGLDLCPPAPPTPEFVHLANGLAVVERRSGDVDAAEEWLSAARGVAAELGDEGLLGYVDNGWGMLELARGAPQRAETAFRDALARDLDPFARVTVTLNLSDALLRQGRAAQAQAAAREAERLALHHHALLDLPEVYRRLGAVTLARRDPEGMVFYEQALEICREHGLPPFETAVTQQQYGMFEAALGDAESAAARLREARRLFGEAGAAVEEAAAAAELERLQPAPDDTHG